MEISCKIIEDLLPLYAEGLVSQETAAAVEAHLVECENCRHILNDLQAPPQVMPKPTEGLKTVRRELRKRIGLLSLFCILLTASLLVGAFAFLYQPAYPLTAEEAIAQVVEEDGQIVVYFTPEAGSSQYIQEIDPDTGKHSVTITACKRMASFFQEDTGPRGPMTFSDVSRIWFASTSPEQEDVLLWGEPIDGGRVTLPRLFMRYYFFLALVTAIPLGILWLILRKKKYGFIPGILALYLFSYAGSIWFATGNSMLIYDPLDSSVVFALSACLGVLIGSCALCGIKLCKMKMQDKSACKT